MCVCVCEVITSILEKWEEEIAPEKEKILKNLGSSPGSDTDKLCDFGQFIKSV